MKTKLILCRDLFRLNIRPRNYATFLEVSYSPLVVLYAGIYGNYFRELVVIPPESIGDDEIYITSTVDGYT